MNRTSSATIAVNHMFMTRDQRKMYDIPELEDVDIATAREAIDFVRNTLANKEKMDDFTWNLVTVVSRDAIETRDVGIAAFAVVAYQRAKGEEIEQAIAAKGGEKVLNEHFGTVGEKVTVTVTVTDERAMEARRWYMMPATLYKMVDADGRRFAWFSSNSELEVGKTYTITDTIKAHNEYNGRKETILTRCKAVMVETPVTA